MSVRTAGMTLRSMRVMQPGANIAIGTLPRRRNKGKRAGSEILNRKLDERFSGRLLDEFKYSVTREFPLTKFRLYAYMLALIVHTSTLAILGLAILCFATNSTWLGFLGILILLLWIAVMLPYRRRLPGRVIPAAILAGCT